MGLQPFFKSEFMLLACEKHTMIYDFCNLKCYCCRVLIGLVSLLDTKCLKMAIIPLVTREVEQFSFVLFSALRNSVPLFL